MSSILLDKNGNLHPDFILAIQMGKIEGARYAWRFGFSEINTAGIQNTIHDAGVGTYTYHLGFGVNAKKLDITSTIPLSDDGIKIFLEGLSPDGTPQTETVLVGATSLLDYSRLCFMKNSNGVLLSGDVNAFVTGTANSVGIIHPYAQTSLKAMCTIPKGYIGFLHKGTTSIGGGKEGRVDYVSRHLDGVFTIGERVVLYQSSIDVIRPFIPLDEFSDIEVRFTPIQSNTAISASFGLVLLDKKIHDLKGII